MENVLSMWVACKEKNTRTLYGSTLPASAFIFVFLIIYLFGYFTIFRNWNGKHRAEASSCLISLAHGTPAVLLAIFSMLINSQGNFNFASPNTQFQNIVLEYSIAYFFMDILHYLIFFPSDVLFIGHHLATLYVFVTCRYLIHHGAIPILVLLVLAEVTSACQNTWSLVGYQKSHVPAAARFYDFLSPLFYGFYTVVRGIFGPVFVYRMGVFYASGAADGMIPRWAWVSWMCVIVSAVFASVFWVSNLWINLYYEHRNKEVLKK